MIFPFHRTASTGSLVTLFLLLQGFAIWWIWSSIHHTSFSISNTLSPLPRKDVYYMRSRSLDSSTHQQISLSTSSQKKTISNDAIGTIMHQLNSTAIPREVLLSNTNLASRYLCLSAFTLDITALRYLIHEIGISPHLIFHDDHDKSALHCLAVIGTMAGGHERSETFSALEGRPSYMASYLLRGMHDRRSSVCVREVIEAVYNPIAATTRWLLQAGVNPMVRDTAGNTCLHHAAQGGLLSLVQVLLDRNEDYLVDIDVLVNARNALNRTALHYAAINGHAQLLQTLIQHHGDVNIQDIYGISPHMIVSSPGAISAADAMLYFNIKQVSIKQLDADKRIYDHHMRGKGGWNSQRSPGYESYHDNDHHCDVDQYDADELLDDDLFQQYIAMSRPILIRGLIDTWPLMQSFTRENMIRQYGRMLIHITEIPYPSKFGNPHQGIHAMLREYIINNDTSSRPWYMFMSHPIPKASEDPTSMIPYRMCPTPRLIYDAVRPLYPRHKTRYDNISRAVSREMFVNAQVAFGRAGSGAAFHFHNTAWNALLYGAKKWFLYPPRDAIASNLHILDFINDDMISYSMKGIKPSTCVQLAGDVMIVPENWGHGVVNIEESVAVATEIATSMWRIKPGTVLPDYLSDDSKGMKI